MQPLRLQRRELALDIFLPIGFESGSYEFRLVNQNFQTVVSQQVTSTMKDHAAILKTTVDLRAVPTGPYQLAIQLEGEDWHLFPAQIE